MKREKTNFVTKSVRLPKDANTEALEWSKKLGIPFNTYLVLALRQLNQAHRNVNKEPQKKSEFSLGFDLDLQDEILRKITCNESETAQILAV